jgi:chorismate mutase
MDKTLARLRARMDRVNARLVSVLQERARLVETIAAHKARSGARVADVRRERAMLKAALAPAPRGFPPAVLRKLLTAVFRESRRHGVRARRTLAHNAR